MHLTLDELLAVRDGDADAAVVAHATSCAECAAEVARLAAVGRALRELPTEGPATDLWPALRRTIEHQRWQRRWWRIGWAAAGLFIAVTLVAAVRGGIETWHEAKLARETRTLEAQSQRLEDALHGYQRSSAVSGRTAGTVVELEDRIAVIDARLAQLGADPSPTPDVLDLWRQRVTLLDALVSMHTDSRAYVGL